MAIQLVERRVCDMCSGTTDATHTVSFQWEGKAYDLDVCDKHADSVRSRFHGLLSKARESAPNGRATGKRVSARKAAPKRSRRAGKAAREKAERAEIRAWAEANGYTVSPRGRIPGEVITAFKADTGRVDDQPSRQGARKGTRLQSVGSVEDGASA